MRKIIIVIFVTAVILFTRSAFAQTSDITNERIYLDYIQKMDVYRQTRSDYDLARLNYLSSKTLVSKSAAQAATLKMLQMRDEVVVSHLNLLRTVISGTLGLSDSDKNSYYSQIDPEISWYKGHENELSSAGSLEDLVNESQKAKDRFTTVTQILMYNTLGGREIGKVAGFRAGLNIIIGTINSKLGEIRGNGDKNTQKAERWLIDVDDRLKRGDQKLSGAKDSLSKLKDQNNRDKQATYNDFQTQTIESNQFLKEGSSFLKEIVKEVRTAD